VDGPPGIGCPVHAATTGCDVALVVTEPSSSGVHDLLRVLELLEHFHVDAAVVVNKSDLAPEITSRIESCVREAGAEWLGGIPFSSEVPRALSRGQDPLVVDVVGVEINRIWNQLARRYALS